MEKRSGVDLDTVGYMCKGMSALTFNIQLQLLTTPWKEAFENTVGKGDNADDQQFLLFPVFFYSIREKN